MLKNTYNGTTNCDCAIIGPIASTRVTSQVLVDNNNLFKYAATGRADDSSHFLGRSVCFSGARSASDYNRDVTCGTIVDSDETKFVEGRTLVTQVVTDIRLAYPGDSGAPFGSGGNFLGVLQGFLPDGRLIYSRSANIRNMNVNLTY